MESKYSERTTLVLGEGTMKALSEVKVILFGVGGVGSWCAEGLVRSGVEHLTIVDFDVVSESNVNRQLMATTLTVGRVKVEALKERLLSINPQAEIVALKKQFSEESSEEFSLDDYDYIIDCIDTLKDKISLILCATKSSAVFFSSMGAARKVDPTRIKVTDFWKVRDCPLGAALRKRMRQKGTLPERSFLCVYGDEVLSSQKGSLVHITSIFGMTLCGLVIKDIFSRQNSAEQEHNPSAMGLTCS